MIENAGWLGVAAVIAVLVLVGMLFDPLREAMAVVIALVFVLSLWVLTSVTALRGSMRGGRNG